MIINNLISGGGGLKPTIVVTAPTGSTVTCDGTVIPEDMVLNPEWRNLPSGYTQVEYLQSTGTQYINTGVLSTNMSRAVLKFSPQDVTNFQAILCSDGGYAMKGLAIIYDNGYFEMFSNYSTYSETHVRANFALTANTTYEADATLISGSQSMTIAGQTFTSSNAVKTNSLNEYIFANNSGGTANAFAKIKLYSLKIYDGSTLIFDYVPCLNTSIGKYGLYDLVSNTFFGNSGTGDFTGDEAVNQYINAGTWTKETTLGAHTIVATLGGATRTETVVVSEIALYPVSIAYATYLYNLGDECASLTGGWTGDTKTILWSNTYSANVSGVIGTKNANSLYMTPGTNYYKRFNFVTTNKINIQDYSRLCINCTVESALYHGIIINFYNDISSSSRYVIIESGYSQKGNWKYTIHSSGLYIQNLTDYSVGTNELSFDLPPGLSSGYCEVLVFRGSSGDPNAQLAINKIWLE